MRTLGVQRASDLLDLPPTTHRNLELTQTLRGEDAPTLLSLLDTCRTGMGSRALRHWLTHPLRERRARDPAPRRDRGAARCTAQAALRDALRGSQRRRAHHRALALRQVRPRELAGLRATLQALPGAARSRCRTAPRVLLDMLREALAPPAEILALLAAAIADEPAVLLRDGGVIAAGYDAELDELRAHQRRTATPSCSSSRARERARTGIANLRVQYNKVHGFYIEVTQGQAAQGAGRLPAPPDAEERRALHHAGAEGLRGQGAVGAGPRAGAREAALRAAARPPAGAPRAAERRWRARWPSLDALAALAERAATLGLVAARSSCASRASTSRPAATRWSRRGCSRPAPATSCRTTAGSTRRAGCSSSPARTWAARAPSCARSR